MIRRAALRCLVWGSWVATLAACDLEQDASPPKVLAATVVHYELAVDWDGASFDGGRRRFVTDLGYEVWVSRWVQSSTSIELIACERERSHPFDHDVSVVTHEIVEELTEADVTTIGTGEGSGLPYCDVYQVLGRLPVGDEPDVVTWIEGEFRAPGSEEVEAFFALGTVPISVLPSLATGAWDDTLAEDEARVQLVRYPARAFDGLELASMSELDIAYAAAQRLAQSADVPWYLGD
ncbi:hypothetical protein DB30_06396 [Enhygromyxa salina]|uniref:Lipoprotein n=1 Tax=Enhygromyxa salina TaxID=215803 RepID=A0A0C2CYU9_9BACT|nr:hypothetical protein [Enhygromyxa salina]KIG14810.1 hypothetical protein DB30_06396 [Enhygromyxa salina]